MAAHKVRILHKPPRVNGQKNQKMISLPLFSKIQRSIALSLVMYCRPTFTTGNAPAWRSCRNLVFPNGKIVNRSEKE